MQIAKYVGPMALGLVAITAYLLFSPSGQVRSLSTNDLDTDHVALDKKNIQAKSLTQQTTPAAKEKPMTMQAQPVLMPHERIRQLTNKSDFQYALLEDHDQHKRYPPNTTRITDASTNPLTQRYAVDERSTVSKEDGAALTIWSDKKYYALSDTVNVFAKLSDDQGQLLKNGFKAELVSGQSLITAFALEDANQDGLYTYSLQLSEVLEASAKSGIYKILIKPNNHNSMDAIAFTLSQPNIALTGKFKDSITSEGHLSIQMEVSVEASNRFYAQASLHNSAGTPIGETQFSGELSMGNQWIELIFPGLLLHDAQEDGPYVLKQVSLAKVTMPLQRGPLEEPNYETEAYRLESFSKTPYK